MEKKEKNCKDNNEKRKLKEIISKFKNEINKEQDMNKNQYLLKESNQNPYNSNDLPVFTIINNTNVYKKAFSYHSIRQLMKKIGATIISPFSMAILVNDLEEYIIKMTKLAVKFANHAHRKKILVSDILLAKKYVK
ncbi:MAG: histone-like protein [Promethearchaeota archaeon]